MKLALNYHALARDDVEKQVEYFARVSGLALAE